MRIFDWSHLDNEDLADEITLVLIGIEDIERNKTISLKAKKQIIDEYLDKLKSLYDEQRKRKKP